MVVFGIFFLSHFPLYGQDPDGHKEVVDPELAEEANELPKEGIDIAKAANALELIEKNEEGLKILILGDSMALSGYADTLDGCFRSCPGVSEVRTIIACGTNPLSWLKPAPYSKAKTRCGFLKIENGEDQPKVTRDIYGMKKNHKPSPHLIPKMEDMIEEMDPDIIVFQCGNNFFDLFKKGTEPTEKAGLVIDAHIRPLRKLFEAGAPNVRKFYWVTPPAAGNVTEEVQDFISQRIEKSMAGLSVMLNSREVTKYPYKVQAPDKMHFWGQESLDWGRDIFRMIAKDLGGVKMADVPTLASIAAKNAAAAGVANLENGGDANNKVRMRLKLVAMSEVPDPKAFAPYEEYVISCLYDVLEVKSGKYEDKQLLIKHPAYIKLVKQDLSNLKVAAEYDFEVVELEDNALWATTKGPDEFGPIELFPYMLEKDLDRHPDAHKEDCCGVEKPEES